MSMNRFLQKHDGRPFHSSGYARAAYGDAIGSTTPVSFEKRIQTDKNRQVIGRYADSNIVYKGTTEIKGAYSSAIPTETLVSSTPRTRLQVNSRDRRTAPQSNNRQQSVIQKPGFSQPPVRRYDPFG